MTLKDVEITKRHATQQDFEENRDFVLVHIDVSSSGYVWRSSRRPCKLSRDARGGAIRLLSYGSIEWFTLGDFNPSSSGSYHLSGAFIDYLENVETLEEAAKAFLEETRQRHIALHEEELARIRSVAVTQALDLR